ncbi:mandelate racemase/muconate lactonizing enzyme family protein [Phytopseudomonas seleniipraecipitans]|uniref:L-alanine-DL-glutamate epimerase n=1 Tax=Phytopseudomonas seleniipraecipitans TaxID=640205 RepID=A0A1G7GBZ1_9GAMM|nr:mandelate racemase/muconate lactonizing enzyme family protein [Pseudomonas seleniipraecipitans]SDE85613.1 L-alanine-DL-glutamate epimerase [Pseudomonas seleniipraecipitans]
MTIQRIEIIRVAIPFSAGGRVNESVEDDDAFNAASPNISRMESLLVRLQTDDGRVGWGEAFGHGLNPVTFSALRDLVGPFFLGTLLADREATMEKAMRAFHGFGRTGAVLYALSAIDIALWDLAAQQAGLPLCRFLGGESRQLELYASLVSYGNDPEEVARQVRRVYDLGYRRLKLHETAPAAIAAAREALPADAQLMVDTNCPWRADEAVQVAESLRGLNLTWLEEPVWPPDDFAGLARVRQTGVPISAGENASGIEGLRQLLAAGAVDVVQPSVAKIGGVSGMLQAFAMARDAGVHLVPHCFYYGPGLMAAAHLTATLGADVALEVPLIEFERNLHAWLDFQPHMHLPDRPGLGFEPDAQVLREATIDSYTLTL